MQASIKYSTSRAAESYGYNRVTVTDLSTGKKYITVGGGYDMTGKAVGNWIADIMQSEIAQLVPYQVYDKATGFTHNDRAISLYGLEHNKDKNVFTIDGACGMSAVEQIVKATGNKLRTVNELDKHKRYKKTLGFSIVKLED